MVVLSHLVHIEGKYGRGDHLLTDGFLYGIAGVDLFFVISGFVMIAVSQWRQDPSASRPIPFFYNRVTRIYPVYWFYSALVLAVFLYRPEMVNSAQGNQVNIIESFFLWPQRLAPLLAVAWTLTHEMYFYLVFTFMLCGESRQTVRHLVTWLVVVIVGDAMMGGGSRPELKIIFHPLTLEFIAGCFVALIIDRGIRGYGRTVFACGGIVLIANMLIGHLYLDNALPDKWHRVLVFGLPSALMVYGAVASEFSGTLRFPKWLISVGDASYSIYLSHVLVLSLIGRIWYHLGQNGLYDNVLVMASMLLFVVLYGHLSYLYIEKPMIRGFRRFRETFIEMAS